MMDRIQELCGESQMGMTTQIKDDGPGYLDLRGLSAYSSMGVSTLRDYIKSGGLPSFKLSGKILVRRLEFDQWLEQFRVNQSRDLKALVDDIMTDLMN